MSEIIYIENERFDATYYNEIAVTDQGEKIVECELIINGEDHHREFSEMIKNPFSIAIGSSDSFLGKVQTISCSKMNDEPDDSANYKYTLNIEKTYKEIPESYVYLLEFF